MIDEFGHVVVYAATIDWGPGMDEYGNQVVSVHDTCEGAHGYRPGCVFTSQGELWAGEGRKADEYPYGVIRKWEVVA